MCLRCRRRLTDHGNKRHRDRAALDYTRFTPRDYHHLLKPGTNGYNHRASHGQLINQSLRYLIRRRCDYDRIKRSMLRPTQIAIPGFHLYVLIAKFTQQIRALSARGGTISIE